MAIVRGRPLHPDPELGASQTPQSVFPRVCIRAVHDDADGVLERALSSQICGDGCAYFRCLRVREPNTHPSAADG